jgi:HEPN domain-containing protein
MSRQLFGGVSEQSRASIHRLEGAEALLREDRWRGAMYLAGYSLECVLKKKLMEKFACFHLLQLEEALHQRGLLGAETTIFTHHLESLLRVGGGLERMRRDPGTWGEFRIANEWVPAWRYSPDLANRQDAEDFLRAVKAVRRWINANT